MNKKYTRHQEKIIKDYYLRRDEISLQKLQEQVTELFLAEGKKRERYWKTISSHLQKLGIPQERIDHFVQQDDPKLVAHEIERLIKK